MTVWLHDACTDVQAVHACVHTVLAVTAGPVKMHKSKLLMAVCEGQVSIIVLCLGTIIDILMGSRTGMG